ncbi:aminoglycoside phosphotransferase [Paractinoplanes abujensis]|uniref:Aminoglycoside phosphotransferase (APT) family kinase protein n=1 Tax=Paractinoplanes abujensis TaxID=882441 RepID=A0A7W7CQJ9_9ACTN|nr:aminoglycoside phosphotransferase family protein [Actinoplanes abujensis]MBB4691071.1 aminoglycoside phosphotransferase (APT) family kinase protein [Actinoplanes abujensis]GID17517.1 aminoglycoside phosphotransferase [Actinoplanes abujensis]
MHESAARRATRAALSVASAAGLTVHDATTLHNSNKLTLRLQPCDVLARVAPAADQSAQLEVDIARRLSEAGSPVAALITPEVLVRDDFVITLWTYYEQASAPAIPPAGYAGALDRLHAGMRQVDLPTPHFTDRVAAARTLVADPTRTPRLPDADRAFLAATLDRLSRAVSGRPEQLLHGEPHPGNVLATPAGPVFIDFETCCRGPIEFDLAHAPGEVARHYPGVDHDLLRTCRSLMLALITTWRWDRNDQFPDGHRLGVAWLDDLRRTV